MNMFIFPQTFDASDRHGYAFWIYYYSLVVIGSFFMLNLVLGVLSGLVFLKSVSGGSCILKASTVKCTLE